MIVEHLITKQVEPGKRRLFFHAYNDSEKPHGGKIEVKLLMGPLELKQINAFSQAVPPDTRSVFWADVPVVVAKTFRSFSWSWGSHQGDGVKSKKFEKLN